MALWDIDEIHGFTHTGFYLVWLAENNLVSDLVKQDFSEELATTLNREKGPIHLYEMMDGCLIGDMLSDEGNSFSQFYYEKYYLGDFEFVFDEVKDTYLVSPTWESYDRMVPVIQSRYEKWQRSKVKKPWQFWK